MELLTVGQVVAGKYRIERILGIGGMGMVVAATHLDLDQRVALKLMLPGASEATAERFLREAKAAVRLRGEHVCRVLDVGRAATGAPFIVMEYMEGQDLAHVAAHRGAMRIADAVGYALQSIEGVAEAHANGIVHRDLKPANLFITTASDGSELVKVLDFGISKSSLGGGAGTKTGEIMGTPAYMAPEQMASSKHVDGRADQWALGVIVYQLVSGRAPFAADTLPALCIAVMSAPPPPLHTVRPDLPRAFCDVVARCLEKRPERRYADVAELALALAPFGPSDAIATAHRICKVLRRPSGPALQLAATAVTPAAAPTTLQASAAEVTPATRPRRRTGALVAVSIMVAAAVIAIVAFAGGSDDPRASVQPAPPPSKPEETPPVAVKPAEATMSRSSATSVEKPIERPIEPPIATSAEKPIEPSIAGKPVATSVGKPTEKPIAGKPVATSVGKPTEKPIEQPIARKPVATSVGKPIEKPIEPPIAGKPVATSAEKRLEQPIAGKAIDQPIATSSEKPTEKPTEKSTEKSAQPEPIDWNRIQRDKKRN